MMKRILCIEDNPEMRLGVRMALEGAEFEIDEAENGKEGLARALEILPDLIICDIKMPGMDGFQMLEEMRKHKPIARIPFIFMTGEDPRVYLRKGMNLGANDFILKPFDMNDLIKAVQIRLEEAERTKQESQQAINELSESITRALPHELRTPMTGILGLADILKLQADEMTPNDVKDIAKLLSDSAVRMHQTLEKFWIYTQCLLLRSDNAKLVASRQMGAKDTHLVVQRIAEECAAVHNRSADILLNLSTFSVSISERYLEQVLRQVIDNAFKFSTANTKVVISTSAENNVGVIKVNDSGHGMSEDQMNKINTFMQFNRQWQEQQGLGLGLMIAKHLTEIHGGGFHVSSVPARGTTISLTFPQFQDM